MLHFLPSAFFRNSFSRRGSTGDFRDHLEKARFIMPSARGANYFIMCAVDGAVYLSAVVVKLLAIVSSALYDVMAFI
jgi:hypothetical protein